MKYLCLGYYYEKEFDSISEAEKSEAMKDCGKHVEALNATGKVIVHAGLESSKHARSIRPKNGRPSVTDGPFIETKEQIGSFFIVEANDIDEAVEIASKHPTAVLENEFGWGIEVHPIQPGDIFL